MHKSEEEQSVMVLRYGKAVLLGGGVALAVSLLVLLLAALGISRGLLSGELQTQLTIVSCVAGSFFGGLTAVRRCPARGLLVGLAVGGVLFLLQLTIGLLLYDTLALESGGVGLLFGALCGGAAAGILGRGGKKGAAKGKKYRAKKRG